MLRWAAWWLGLWVAWLVFVGDLQSADIVSGAVLAAAVAAFATRWAWPPAGPAPAPAGREVARAALGLAPLFAAAVRDSAYLCAVAGDALWRRRQPAEVVDAGPGAGGGGVGEALAAWRGSFAPRSIVLDTASGRQSVHRLHRARGENR